MAKDLWPTIGEGDNFDETVPDWDGSSKEPMTISVMCGACHRRHPVSFTPIGTTVMRQSVVDPTKILYATHSGRCAETGHLVYAGYYRMDD